VDESKARAAGFQSTYKNRTYNFCSAGCKEHFEKHPGRFAAKSGGGQKTDSGAAGGQGQEVQDAKAKDPVCGHEVDQAQAQAAGLTSVYHGKIYYFCSYSCNHQFDKDPEQYLKPEAQAVSGGSKAPVVAKEAQDPVCGLPVDTGAAKQAGRTSEYQGKLYYFDTDSCKERFDKDPQHYLSGSTEESRSYLFPKVPTTPDLLLRLRRDSIRAIPPGKGQALVEDPAHKSQVEPAVPPTPPLQPPGQPSAAPQPQTPQAGPAQPLKGSPSPPQPQTPPPAPVPHGGEGHQHD
jgi:YHS domain-containing protein